MSGWKPARHHWGEFREGSKQALSHAGICRGSTGEYECEFALRVALAEVDAFSFGDATRFQLGDAARAHRFHCVTSVRKKRQTNLA